MLLKRVRPGELEQAELAVVGLHLVYGPDVTRHVSPVHDLATIGAGVGPPLVDGLDISLSRCTLYTLHRTPELSLIFKD